MLDLIVELRRELGLALLFISHNLGAVAAVADRVLILDKWVICEEGPVDSVFTSPSHPYTRQLVDSALRLKVFQDRDARAPVEGPRF